jgi:alpha-1,2-glucosyltransferase
VGFASLWFRQTNIVWLAFVASMVIDRRIVIERGQKISPIGRIGLFIKQLFKDYAKVVPFAVNFILFLVFLKINGGITLGDSENHEVSIHLVQIFYCFTFIVMFTWPVWLQMNTLIQYGQFLFGNFGLNLAFNCVSFAAIKYIINNYTIVHPFLLADNRHFTFYIYRKLIAHKYSEFIAIPLYHFSIWAIVTTLLKSKRLALSPITILTFIGATCLTLIPSPLFEPRYYIVPLIIFRLFTKPASKFRSMYEFAWLTLINIITILVFMNYEIIWESEGKSIQRIIW